MLREGIKVFTVILESNSSEIWRNYMYQFVNFQKFNKTSWRQVNEGATFTRFFNNNYNNTALRIVEIQNYYPLLKRFRK